MTAKSVTRTFTRGEAFIIAWYILTHLHRRKFTITVTEPEPG